MSETTPIPTTAPPGAFSPSSGPGLLAIDGCCNEAALHTLAAAFGVSSIIGPRPVRQLEGVTHPNRSLALFRFADLDAARAASESDAATQFSQSLEPTDRSARMVLGHHSLGDDAPPPADECGKSYLVVHGFISNREVYGAYLRGLKDSGLLVTNRCERILMMGPSNVRQTVKGPFITGEYFEILSFPTQANVEEFWLSDSYAELVRLRQGAVDVYAAIFPASEQRVEGLRP